MAKKRKKIIKKLKLRENPSTKHRKMYTSIQINNSSLCLKPIITAATKEIYIKMRQKNNSYLRSK